jgi:hypothetical protein
MYWNIFHYDYGRSIIKNFYLNTCSLFRDHVQRIVNYLPLSVLAAIQ